MITRLISFDGGGIAAVAARDALMRVGGVVAAELTSGGRGVRLWASGDLDEQSIRRALDASGAGSAHIGAPVSPL
ncbi:MAG: hypothetical protein GX558_02470 [Clostridiales bacterium]|nr:hypothetical protein [Clostridiales bacterium]